MILIREKKDNLFEVVSGENDFDLTFEEDVEILYYRCISHLTETWDSPSGPTSFRHSFLIDDIYFDAVRETCGESAFMDRLGDFVEGLIRDMSIIDGNRIGDTTVLRVKTTGTYERNPKKPFSITVELRVVPLSEATDDTD